MALVIMVKSAALNGTAAGLTKSSLSLDIYLTFVVLTSAAIQNYKSNGNIFRQAVTDIQIE
jgi:hypothetical protein